MLLDFDEKYPHNPPSCRFVPPLFHPNVNVHSGQIDLPFVNEDCQPQVTVKRILIAIQNMLSEPVFTSKIHIIPYIVYCNDRLLYNKIVRESIKYASKCSESVVQNLISYYSTCIDFAISVEPVSAERSSHCHIDRTHAKEPGIHFSHEVKNVFF